MRIWSWPWSWIRKLPIPALLGIVSLALTVLAVVLLWVSLETSDTTEVSGPPVLSVAPTVTLNPTVVVTPSGRKTVTAKPTITVTPTVTVSLTQSPSAASSGPSATVTETTVRGKASDSLELGLFGLAAFFALIAVFFGRIQSFTLPGGAELTLADPQAAIKAVAAAISMQASQAATVTDPQTVPDPAAQLAVMARIPRGESQGTVVATTKQSAETTGQATVLTLQYARALLNAASKKPADFYAYAAAYDLSPQEAESVLAGEIPETLWNRLAQKALARVAPAS
jgi:hypothetical protein